jgi:hypothetical protein
MRRTAYYATIFGLPVILSGCTGFGTFLDHTFSLPGYNPNLPMTDSENVRRVLGQSPGPTPLLPEQGNVWPGPERPEPTLEDIQKNPGTEDQRGFPPTTVPGAQPGAPAGRQPRPVGSSTPPSNLNDSTEVGPSAAPGTPPLPTPRSSVTGPGPLGRIVQTPSGPAVDAGGTNAYRQLTTPQGPGAIMVPNSNGTSTIINPNGTIQTVPSH